MVSTDLCGQGRVLVLIAVSLICGVSAGPLDSPRFRIRPNITSWVRPVAIDPSLMANDTEPESTCDYKVSGETIYMKSTDIARVYRSYFKTAEELGVKGCKTTRTCLDSSTTQCGRYATTWACSTRQGVRSGCIPPAKSDYGKCCETCTTPALVNWPLSHPTYGTVYVVQYPSLDIYQPFFLGTCGIRNCKKCVQKTAVHTFLVSTSPVVDPPGPSAFIPLIFHTEELPSYCTCVRR